MKQRALPTGAGRRLLSATSARVLAVVALAVVALTSASLPSPAAAAEGPACRGTWVRTLGGPQAVTRKPMDDLAGLRQRLSELEPAIRAAVAKDSTLGPEVAEAVIAAIRSGSGIRERPMRRDEELRWMAYQPRPDQFDTISPVCLRLKRDYDAFEITVEVPEKTTATAAQRPTCAISATRSCAASTITVDVGGSSPGARVTFASSGRSAVAVGGQGEVWTVEDPGPYDREAVLLVRAETSPEPGTARVFHFLVPKICGNLAYLGEGPSKTIPAQGAPPSCEKSVQIAACTGGQPVVPAALPPSETLAEGCEDEWVVRPYLFAFFPTGSGTERDVLLPTGLARETFELEDGYGLGASFERRFGPVFGLETAAMFGRGDSRLELDNGAVTGSDSHETNFYALTVGPNFHLLGCGGADLYLGPFAGYGGFADPNYWVGDHHFAATFDGRFVWGAQVGLDLPFSSQGRWGFHGGLRYFRLSQDTDAGSLKVDPWLAEVGLAYRF